MYLWLITRVEDEDMWKTNRGETRGKKTRTLEDDDEEPLDEEEHEETLDGRGSERCSKFIVSAHRQHVEH